MDDGGAVLHCRGTCLNPSHQTTEPFVVAVLRVAFVVLAFEGTRENHVLQVVGLVSLTEDTAGSQVLVLAFPRGSDIHAYQDVGQRRTSHVLAEAGHAVAVTSQGTIQPQVADLGSFAQTAEETAHTLGTSAGVAVQVGGNGNLVVLCIKRTNVSICELHVVDLLADATNEGVTIGSIRTIINVGGYYGAGAVVSRIHQFRERIQISSVLDDVNSIRSLGKSPRTCSHQTHQCREKHRKKSSFHVNNIKNK